MASLGSASLTPIPDLIADDAAGWEPLIANDLEGSTPSRFLNVGGDPYPIG